MNSIQPSYDVLVADDDFDCRDLHKSILENLNSDLNIVCVANPAQAVKYFETKRDNNRGLLIISDGNMSSSNYDYTDTPQELLPTQEEVKRFGTTYIDLFKHASEWAKKTGTKAFSVLLSGNMDNPDDLNKLEEFQANNFDNPFKLQKASARGNRNELTAILGHCNKLFTLAS